MSTAVHITRQGAQINFVDLPPSLTYGAYEFTLSGIGLQCCPHYPVDKYMYTTKKTVQYGVDGWGVLEISTKTICRGIDSDIELNNLAGGGALQQTHNCRKFP
jgi:hypothetical protein